ncbi:aminotransferase class I/II-fold pyridoxal phosphate-dependent enzyme [Sorangium sp. So ce381]|uniref:aminotransferase class I/II-fold pyridoxal phosphate-dependent enzyme n=1 Tax=Sorangium sp. So ce381 TaxID=3133307 RepID=UPI003F5B14F7
MVEGRASIDPEGVLFTAGSIAGIDLLVRCFCEPGEDRVCVSTPTFPAFAQYARFHGVEVVDVPLEGRDFNVLRTEAMSALGAKLTFVCTPNNPVGTTVAAEQVLELVQRSRGLVVVDEAYVELADVGSFARLVSQYPNLVVLRTFSKAWGLAGLRAGVVIAAPDVVHTLRVVQDPFACTAPVQAALARELHRVGELRAVLARLRAERAALVAALTRSPAVEYVYPTSTNFVLVRLRRPDAVYAALEREPDVFAANAHAHVPGTLKVSMGRPDNDARLLSFLQAHG